MSESHEENQECFIPANWDISTLQANKDKDLPYLNINKLLEQAKQLHNPMRPQQFSARTCFLELPIYKLPDYLQEECVEEEQISKQANHVNIIQNPEEFSIQQYFQDFEVVYDKMKMYANPNFSLLQYTSRFKPITHLSSDFHQKLFKQLYTIDTKNSSTHITINDEFDSNFQSGNLGVVYKKPQTLDRQYFLLLENDINTHGYTSWFFFKVKSCGKGRAYFHIINLSKSSYLYRIGWKISIFSVSKYHNNFTKWFKGGINIQTYPSNFQKRSKGGGTYNCLYFQYQFDQNQTEVYFAMSRPYTYTMLTKKIQKMQEQCIKKNISMQLINTIYSISCNLIPIIVLNNVSPSKQKDLQVENIQLDKSKKCIVFMARQHPGEVVGSQYMEKLMKTMISDNEQVKFLLNKFNIILIPMINPDGVIHGNSRCNLGGLDLNRQWMKQNIKEVTPQTYYLRKFIWDIHQKIGIQFLIDLHGHSKKMNSFCFCNKVSDKLPTEYFPFLIARYDKRFDISSCTFNTTPDKKNTLRNQLYEFGMKNCVTVENSYFGYWDQKTAKLFKDTDYEQMANSLIKSLHLILFLQLQNLQIQIPQKIGQFRQQLIAQLKISKQAVLRKNSKSPVGDDMESQSDPEGDIMKPQQMIKIYEYPQVLSKKKVESAKRKKTKDKKMKQPITKQEDIRGSQPMRNQKEYLETKNHKSQKKLQVVIANPKKNATQQRFRQTFIKPVIPLSKKMIEKREGVIKQTFLSMNQNQDTKDQSVKQSIKNKILGNPFNKFQNEATMINNKNKRNQGRIKTDISEQRPLKYQPSLKFAQYQRMRQERLKLFLNQTLSIIKVDNQGNTGCNQPQQMNKRKNSLKQQKFKEKTNYHRLNTDGKQVQSSLILQIDNQSNPGMSIARQRQQRKRFLSRNYKKQLTKRKKILNTHSIQQQAKKYRRFESFIDSNQNTGKKQSVKLQCNSVFYYFPVL